MKNYFLTKRFKTNIISFKNVLVFLFIFSFSLVESKSQSRLHLLHLADAEAAVGALTTAPNFAALIDKFEEQGNQLGVNTLILSSGDNYLPGAFFSAAGDLSMRQVFRNASGNNTAREGNGFADIYIHNILGVMASAIGNHEFDLGTGQFRDLMVHQIPNINDVRYLGTSFPYLSSNLDFTGDGGLNPLYTNVIQANTNFITTNPAAPATKKIAPATIITINGERYGIVGATTPIVENISSLGGVKVKEPGRKTNDMMALASIIQPYIDELRNVHGINKIIVLAHMQQLSYERELIKYLSGVDIVIAGGSNSILADNNDRLFTGDSKVDNYPIVTTNKDNEPALILNTDGGYKYVGRLLVDFDANGVILPNTVDNSVSGAWAADNQNVTALFGTYANAFTNPNSKAAKVKTITDGLSAVIAAKDGSLFGWTNVFLEGRRTAVRTKETNLGNLSADANLWYAKQYDPTVQVSIKNGGGIRAEIGVVKASGTSTYSELPPEANPLANKLAGQVSRLDIENSMRFNNDLTVLTVTASQLIQCLNHGVAATAPNATPGQFAQVGGVKFVYDPAKASNNRIVTAFLINDMGVITDTLMINNQMIGDPNRPIRMVTLGFLTTGGDSYPINSFETANPTLFNRLNLRQVGVINNGLAQFAEVGTEQDAFAEYMVSKHTTKLTAYNKSVEGRITRVNSIVINAQPKELVNCFGTTNNFFEFNASVTESFYDYYVQWYKDGKTFGSLLKNTTRINLPALTYEMSGTYNAQIWTVLKFSEPTQAIEKIDITNKFLLNVLSNTVFSEQPMSQSAQVGEKLSFTFDVHTYGIIGGINNQKVSVQWYKGTTALTDNNRIAGSKSSILSIRDIQTSDYTSDYYVVVTGQCGTVTSQNFAIMAPPNINITKQPITAEKCNNEEFTFGIEASINDNTTLSYQWYVDGVKAVDNANVKGSTTNTLMIKLANDAKINCEITSTVNNLTKMSDTVDAIVNELPTITKQPVAVTVESGKELILNIEANSNKDITYQWYKNNVKLDRNTNDSLVVKTATTTDAGTYYCEVTNLCGTIKSDEVMVTISASSVVSSVEDDNAVLVYPNPTSDFINLDFLSDLNTNTENLYLEILTITGNSVLKINLINNYTTNHKIDLKSLNIESGVYLINVIGANNSKSTLFNYIK